jgi:hypothetical protein
MGYSIYTNTAGVMGNSEFGIAVYGHLTSPSNTRSAVVGWSEGAGNGVVGISVQAHGVYGETGNDTGAGDYAGVYGRSTHTQTFGVLGESEYGIAVEGRIGEPGNTQPAISGWNAGGGPGVEGHSANDTGVFGDGASYGGHFVSAGGMALFAEGDAEVSGDLSVGGSLSGGTHTHTGADIVNGSVTSDDIQDRRQTISFPANALNYRPGSIINEDAAGLVWAYDDAESAYLIISRPADWDGESDVEMRLYFLPTITSRGNVHFFVQPRAFNPGDVFEKAEELSDDPVQVLQMNTVREQVITIPAPFFEEGALWAISIRRAGWESTYRYDVVLMSVALSYNAVR